METIKPYQESDFNKKRQVRQMFDNISSEYDRLNRFISFGLDIKWRKKIVSLAAQQNPKTILDIATGTGDLAIMLSSIGVKIIGIDISQNMISVGQQKIKNLKLQESITLQIADGENLPFEKESFDLVSVAFGVRNFENLQRGLSEIRRVLSKEGTLLILETSIPTNPLFRAGYMLHSNLLLPLVGKLFSRDKKAYGYLSRSASRFPYGAKFLEILLEVGFDDLQFFPQSLGVATIYFAKKK